MAQSLFEDSAAKDHNLIITQQKKTLTKNQKTFNRLTSRIHTLRLEIERTEASLLKLNSFYATEIFPLEKETASEKITLVKELASKYKTIKLSENKKWQVETLMLHLLDEAFEVILPDAEAEKLYNDLSKTSYIETLEEQKEDLKEDLKEQLYGMFGIDINLDEIDETPEGFAKFQQKMQEQFEQQQQKKASRKKTKKQLEKEALLQQQEEAKKRSIRSIYMSLAKLFHPDTETDETLKLEKENVMKELTIAYNQNDLSALLKLELKWIVKENDHLDKLTDEKLAIYNAVLTQQVKELEIEKIHLHSNPAYENIIHLSGMNEKRALLSLENEKKGMLFQTTQFKKDIQLLQNGKLRAAINYCIEKYYYDDNDDDDFSNFLEMLRQQNRF